MNENENRQQLTIPVRLFQFKLSALGISTTECYENNNYNSNRDMCTRHKLESTTNA